MCRHVTGGSPAQASLIKMATAKFNLASSLLSTAALQRVPQDARSSWAPFSSLTWHASDLGTRFACLSVTSHCLVCVVTVSYLEKCRSCGLWVVTPKSKAETLPLVPVPVLPLHTDRHSEPPLTKAMAGARPQLSSPSVSGRATSVLSAY
jgi:hypothetical protein